MNKKEFTELLILHSYKYEETDKGIEVKIKNDCRLSLIFKDDLLIECNGKIKEIWWLKSWTKLSSFLRNSIISFVGFMLLAIVLKMNGFFTFGIVCFIPSLCIYYYRFNQIKKAKEILGIK